jgi:hypothetical protein
MAFEEPVLGGNNALVREEVKSPNYVAGVSGWDLGKNGDAEFNSIVVRGTVEADGASGSYIKIQPGTPFAKILLKAANPSTVVGSIYEDSGKLYLTGDDSSNKARIILTSNTLTLPNTVTLDTSNGTGNIYLSSGADVVVSAGQLTNAADSTEFFHGYVFTQNISFAVTASNTQTVNFPTALPAGVVPRAIHANINALSGTTTKWTCKTTSYTNTGFTLWSASGDGTTSAWTNVPVNFTVIV